MGAVVHQENGENAVVDDGAHQFRGAIEKGLQIERGVERIGEFHQVSRVGRLNAGVQGIEMRVSSGAIVALQVGIVLPGWRSAGHVS